MKSLAAKRANDRYRGPPGRDYHQRVNPGAARVQSVIAGERARKIQPHVDDRDDVLEFGVGVGLNLRLLKCRRRIGYDISDAGREMCEEHGIHFTTEADFHCGEFSVILCHHTLEHVPDPLAILEQLKSWLRADGRLLLYVPFETHRSYRRYRPGDVNQHLFSWNPLSLGNLVTVAGFRVLDARIRRFGYEQRLAPLHRLHPWLYRAALGTIRRFRPADEVFLIASPDVERDS